MYERKTKLNPNPNPNSTIEINKNFYCSNCCQIKDYSEDLCDFCFTKENGYFVGMEFGMNPIFEIG